ncbi:Late competence development protein ComFB [Thiorhodococcus drewsii AZ1]|uniref:Late competence development protein ComFB n=1 Tax=Thiorhodococcus drewsii AZ1 TaxID=765913 RepID=G2E329_9GAMM|nr:late competence development ComFB family protein [Thiorhodococcus drewsii]EGV30491.1 Late competence development protein ComFB [Thiorhodococcus drewsii AZ1]
MPSNIGNYYERLVMECIREAIETDKAPDEAAYIEDLACVALNNLPPRYIRHSIDLASHLSDEEQDRMQRQVNEAVEKARMTIQRRSEDRDQNLD